jgi:arabinogalactan oligomer/maltooligosaccharide transport system substrate-binding protein
MLAGGTAAACPSHHSKENPVLIRRKSFLALGAAGASAALLAACGSSGSDSSSASDAGAASDGGGDAAPKADANADLVIWADEAKATALKEPAEKWGTDNGLKVAVQTVANDLQTSFVTANQAGNGPDIVMGAHDWIGNLVQNGAISTVQLPSDAKDTTLSVALDAMQYNGQTYGVPYAVETLVLFANKKLTDTPEPKTFEELVEAGTAGGADNVLSLPVGEEGDAYHMEPLYTSAGGYLFGKDSEGSYDPEDLGVGKEGSIAAGEKMKELGEKGVMKTSITGDNAISLFTDGKAAYLISGPWAIADIKKAKIDFALSAVPGFEGMDKAVPFAGVNGFYAAANGKNAGNAQTFLADVAGTADLAKAMFAKNELPPVNKDLQKELAADNPEMAEVAELAEKNAEPMPAIPAMGEVWKPLGQAEANIIGGAEAKSTMESAGKQIASKVA